MSLLIGFLSTFPQTVRSSIRVMPHTLVRYWGSHFRSAPHASALATEFEALLKRGWKCHVIIERMPENLSWVSSLESAGIILSCMPRPKSKFDREHIQAIRTFCTDSKCDVFHCDNIHMSPLIGAWLAKVPVRVWFKRAMSAHYESCREPRLKERVALTSRLSVMLATRVLAVSESVANDLVELGMKASKFRVLNNPRPELSPSSESRDAVRRRLGIPPEALVFVTLGRVERVKGWDLLLAAFREVAGSLPQVHLLLVGGKEVRGQESFAKSLTEQLACSGVGGRVHFTDHVSDVPAMLGAGDVFVLPSRSEGCCKALLEALEIGLPCVSTDVGNAREVLGDGRGVLVPRNDVAALHNSLLTIAVNDMKRHEMAENSCIPPFVLDRRSYAEWMADFYTEQLEGSTNGPR